MKNLSPEVTNYYTTSIYNLKDLDCETSKDTFCEVRVTILIDLTNEEIG